MTKSKATPHYVHFYYRLGASIIDIILVSFAAEFITTVSALFQYTLSVPLLMLIIFPFYTLYTQGMQFHATLGQLVLSMEVRNSSLTHLSITQHLQRMLLAFVPLIISALLLFPELIRGLAPLLDPHRFIASATAIILPLLWFFIAHFNKKHQTIHDIICKTVVLSLKNPQEE